MGKVKTTTLVLNGFVFLLGLICSTILGLAGYRIAGGWSALASSPAFAPPAAEAKAIPAPAVEATPRDELALKEQESRIEYYRGIFDVCVFSGRNEAAPERVFIACREVVRRAVTQN